MIDRRAVRLSATLWFPGVILSLVAGVFHPDRATANDHLAAPSLLPLVDSNHHSRIQSPMSCHWTKGHRRTSE